MSSDSSIRTEASFISKDASTPGTDVSSLGKMTTKDNVSRAALSSSEDGETSGVASEAGKWTPQSEIKVDATLAADSAQASADVQEPPDDEAQGEGTRKIPKTIQDFTDPSPEPWTVYDYFEGWDADDCYPWQNPNEEGIKEKRTKGPGNIFGVMKYVAMVEDRMRYLEKEVHRLTDQSKNTGESDRSTEQEEKEDKVQDSGDQKSLDSDETQADETRDDDTKGRSDDEDVDDQDQTYVKTGLEPVCKIVDYPLFEAHLTKATKIKSALFALVDEDVIMQADGSTSSSRVSRLCITSDLIWNFFSERLPPNTTRIKDECVILRPFKLLCLFEDELRSHLEHLKEKLAIDSDLKNSTGTEPGSSLSRQVSREKPKSGDGVENDTRSASDKPFSPFKRGEIEETIEHIQCLVNFMDNSISEDLKRHRRYRHIREEKTIVFEDLWHLFAAGDVVYTDDESKQACRILYVHGGQPLYEPVTESLPKATTRKHQVAFKTTTLSSNKRPEPLVLECFYIDYDGKDFGPVARTFEIPFYAGEREISQLPVYPIKYARPVKTSGKEQSREAYQLDRGEKFVRLTQEPAAHREYKGKTLIGKTSRKVVMDDTRESRAGFFDLVDSSRSREQIDSQVIIDFEHAFLKEERLPRLSLPDAPQLNYMELPQDVGKTMCSCGKIDCTYNSDGVNVYYHDRRLDRWRGDDFLRGENTSILHDHITGSNDLTEEHRILLPNCVYGYVLRNLEFYPLDIDLVEEFKPETKNSFNDLVLSKQNRRMVESLVSSHSNSVLPISQKRDFRDRTDLVRGKGQGLIILLHGVPGTGKSSTAECVAEFTGRPLFPITCGNIGVTPEQVQKNLEAMFYLAHKWNCVMLLDEADVFLRARDTHDLQRNSIVSVFLRALEYYAGILFLTTNKVGRIDEAFKSRIHMSLYYDMLDLKATEKIWKVNLDRTRNIKPHVTFDEKEILKFAKKHWTTNQRLPWNGRQIRNAFQSATALAEFEAEQANTDNNKDDNKDNDKVNNKDKDKDGNVLRHENGRYKATMTKDHFKQIAKVSATFDEYLIATLGGDDFDKAKQAMDRNERPQRSAFEQNTRGTPQYQKSQSHNTPQSKWGGDDEYGPQSRSGPRVSGRSRRGHDSAEDDEERDSHSDTSSDSSDEEKEKEKKSKSKDKNKVKDKDKDKDKNKSKNKSKGKNESKSKGRKKSSKEAAKEESESESDSGSDSDSKSEE